MIRRRGEAALELTLFDSFTRMLFQKEILRESRSKVALIPPG
jgi:hypothetical protein